jgi:TonB family protein
MSQNPWLRPESSDATSSQENRPPNRVTAFFSGNDLESVSQVAETLAAHGTGALSTDLALDLVLHTLVEQARDVSGATGAAIALLRDGEMVCRATTGDNAPDLGVRVETGSSLAGACLQTGQVQQCPDTETDTRVSPDACRRLGVRSMLLMPLVDAGEIFGVLQVFSSWPNAFGEREISALQTVGQRIAENKRAAETEKASAPVVQADPVAVSSEAPEPSSGEQDLPENCESPLLPVTESRRSTGNEILSTVLVVLVIAAAVLLGVVVGWRGAAKVGTNGSSPASIPAAVTADSQTGALSPGDNARPSDAPSEPQASASVGDSKSPAIANASQPSSGGLVVTENGRVIYRSPSPSGTTSSLFSGTRLIHRVEPEYPPEARARNLQGSVVLDIQVHGGGTVGDIRIVSGDPVLAKAAVDAVKLWKYQPNFVNGHAVESQARVTVRFRLPG